jgi:hypothetical protein
MLVLLFGSCDKEGATKEDCFPDQATTRQIIDKAATVQLANSKYYLIEAGTIDLRLLPCNLEDTYKQNGLQVIISGNVKGNATGQGEPCCTSNFVITKISR